MLNHTVITGIFKQPGLPSILIIVMQDIRKKRVWQESYSGQKKIPHYRERKFKIQIQRATD